MTTINMATFVVRDSTGSIQVDETVDKFRSALISYQAERETELATISHAVDTVFSQNRGAHIVLRAVATLALNELHVQRENFQVLNDKVLAYVRENIGTRESGAMFGLARGPNGGVCRWADVPVKA